ncbi:MAG: methionyl-tRNA formyltransferase [Oscillospiraceae bacterium]
MRIVFMGTPDFAAVSLKKLIEQNLNIVGVFTQSDKPKGRGYKLVMPPVKEIAIQHNIPVFQPKTLRDEESFEIIKQLNPDIIVVVAYGKILPKNILDFPRLGCVNVHGSLLPKYRGAAPIQYSILNGEKETGITTMFMGEGLDTGDMLLKVSTPIGENETYGELHDRLAVMGSDILLDTLELLEENKITPIKQDDEMSTYAHMIDKKMGEIDFTKPAKEVHNLIRGLSPAPCAYTHLGGKLLKVYKAVLREDMKGIAGNVLCDKEFVVACGDYAVEFTEIQLEGKKRISSEEFLRGRKLLPNKSLMEN